MLVLKNFIDGVLVDSDSGLFLDNVAPATGEVFSKIPKSNEVDVESAYLAAENAFPAWSSLSSEDRFEWLLKLSRAIEDDLDNLAKDESIDNGKPIKLAMHVDIPRAASNFKFYATAALQFSSESHAMANNAINYTLRKPLGVVGCISPWNLPLYLFTWKIAPALAVGNTVVAKPSEVTPVTAFRLSEICARIGFPKGVLNIVHGTGPEVGEAIVKHKKIKAISFTGGTQTGARIAKIAAPMFKKLSLELGGKNPNIIFDDCDYEQTLKTTIHSSFSNQGQICLCGSRIFVHEKIHDKFVTDFVEKTKRLQIGNPLDETTRMGAVVSESHMNKILDMIEIAKAEGGKVLCGGNRVHLEAPNENGFFVAPTIIVNAPNNCTINQQEVFGPVVTIQSFSDEVDVIEKANGVDYGLSATIWTTDINKGHRVADKVEAGIVWVNTWLLRDLRTPFGGVKASGVGREGGFEALHFFTEPKNVCIKYD